MSRFSILNRYINKKILFLALLLIIFGLININTAKSDTSDESIGVGCNKQGSSGGCGASVRTNPSSHQAWSAGFNIHGDGHGAFGGAGGRIGLHVCLSTNGAMWNGSCWEAIDGDIQASSGANYICWAGQPCPGKLGDGNADYSEGSDNTFSIGNNYDYNSGWLVAEFYANDATITGSINVRGRYHSIEGFNTPASVNAGQGFTVSWNTSYRHNVSGEVRIVSTGPINNGNVTNLGEDGSYTFNATGTGPGTINMTLHTCGPTYQGARCISSNRTINVIGLPPPEANIKCNGGNSCSMATGGTVSLSWCDAGSSNHTCANAQSCTTNPGNLTGTRRDGVSVSPASTTTYTLTCTGPGGSTSDTVTVTVLANYDLTVNSSGATSVAMTSSTGAGGTTNYTIPNISSGTDSIVTAPDIAPNGNVFSSWTGCTSVGGTGNRTCTRDMDQDRTITATYVVPTYTLTVTSTGVTGVAISSSTGNSGTTNYSDSGLISGSNRVLTAPLNPNVNGSNVVFSSWTGCTSVATNTCNVTMSSNRTVTANYTINLTASLTATPASLNLGQSTNIQTVVGGSATGNINYSIWWDCPGYNNPVGTDSTPTVAEATAACGGAPVINCSDFTDGIGHKCDNNPNPNPPAYSAVHTYPTPGNKRPIVIVERGGTFSAFGVATVGVLNQPIIDLNGPFTFSATQGGVNPADQTLSISNIGLGTLNWTATDNAAWLTLGAASGATPSGNSTNVNLAVTTGALAPGTYSATITVSAAGATNTPQAVNVTFVVNPPSPISLSCPSSVPYNTQAAIGWTSSGAQSCTISPALSPNCSGACTSYSGTTGNLTSPSNTYTVSCVPITCTSSGGTVTVIGNNRVHRFNGSGTFTTTCAGGTYTTLVVGGGGGGGSSGGGGGAGGFRTTSGSVGVGSFAVVVGNGGNGGTGDGSGANGGQSSFNGLISLGGGGGGGWTGDGRAGASGGGAGGGAGSSDIGGAGTAGQGTSGGDSISAASGGGGGGSSVAGGDPTGGGNEGGDGGAGTSSSISGAAVIYAGGGGGNGDSARGAGGSGGGGQGGFGCSGGAGAAGTPNTGGGGGGGNFCVGPGHAGGSGIVYISYDPPNAVAMTPNSCTINVPQSVPTVTDVNISSPIVIADNSTGYNVTITGNDSLGGSNISDERTLINWQGSNAGQHRGYMIWTLADSFPAEKNHQACAGGGFGVIYTGAPGYGNQYEVLNSCATSVSGSTRTTTFNVRFDPLFTAPTINNDISGYVGNPSAATGWINFDINFALATIPTLTTTGATSITTTSATLNGTVNPNGASTTAGFRWGTSNVACASLPNVTSTSVHAGASTVSITPQNITGLTSGTTYYYCATGTNALGTGYGAVLSFTVTPTLSVVLSATPASGADPLSSVLSASPGGTATGTMNYNFWWDCDDASNVISTVTATCGTLPTPAAGSCLGNASGYKCDGVNTIPQNTTSHVYTPNGIYTGKVIVERSSATPAENRVPITVTAQRPTVITDIQTLLTTTSVTLNGRANPNSLATTAWFRYSPTDPGTCNDTFGTRVPLSGGTLVGSGATLVPYSQPLTGLTSNTTYYFCAIANSTGGTGFGSVLNFTTTPTLSVTISANPASGPDPLTSFLRATPAGTAAGTMNYNFWWNCNDASNVISTVTSSCGALSTPAAGSCIANANGYKCDGVNTIPQDTTGHIYAPSGTYNGKVIIERSSATPAEQRAPITVSAQALPTVTTNSPTSITTISATLNGTVNPNGSSATAGFNWGTSNVACASLPNDTATSVHTGSSAVAITPQSITGLISNTTYYFCAIATNSSGTAYGAVLSFTTTPTLSVTLSANPASGPNPLTSFLRAAPAGTATGTMNYSFWWNCNNASNVFATVVTACGALPAPAAGSCLGNTVGYKCDGVSTIPQDTTGHVYTPNGTFNGKVIIERGSAAPAEQRVPITVSALPVPIVTTTAATSITATSGTLNGTVNPNGSSTTAGFRWGSSNATCASLPNVTPTSIHTGSSTVAITPQNITGLTSNVTYYFCATATNASGTSNGNVLSFTTTPTLSVTISATPSSGGDPLLSVLSATVGGTAAGTMNYNFWYNCNNASNVMATVTTACGALSTPAAGSCIANANGYKCNGVPNTPQSVPAHSYTPGGTYTGKVIIERSTATPAENRTSITVTGAAVPTVITDTQTLLTTSTATLNGRANPNGLAATGWFRYSPTNPGSCNDAFGTRVPLSGGTALGAGATLVAYSQPITGLSPSTTYYFCAIANNAGGNGYGAVLNFTTVPTLSVIISATPGNGADPLSSVLSANPGGTATGTMNYSFWYNCNNASNVFATVVTACGALPAPAAGSCLGNLAGYKCDGVSTAPQAVPAHIYTPNGTYTGKVIVERSSATPAENRTPITVSAAAVPTVITDTQTLLTTSTATLNGRANPNGLAATGWFRYSPTNPGSCNDAFGTRVPLSGGTALGAGATLVAYSQPITGLSPSTTYYFCAIANNAGGNGYGAVLNFTTVPTLSVIISATPGNGADPLSSVLSANPGGTATGTMNYSFWYNCNNASNVFATVVTACGALPAPAAGSCLGNLAGYKCDGVSTAPQAVPAHIYTPNGTYTGKVIVERSSATPAENRTPITVSAAAVPTVITDTQTLLTTSTATLNGRANPNGLAATGWFRYSPTNPGSCNDAFGTRVPLSGGTALGAGATLVAYSQPITGLSPSTTYYFCAIANNAGGNGYGAVLNFTTVPTLSVIISATPGNGADPLSSVLSANPGGTATGTMNYSFWYNCNNASNVFATVVTACGALPAPAAGSCLGNLAGYKCDGVSTAPQAVPAHIYTPNGTYTGKVIVERSSATPAENRTPITVSAAAVPTVITDTQTLLTTSTATLNGRANPNGLAATGWFRYSPTNPGSCNDAFGTRVPLSGGTALGAGATLVAYSQPITGLSPSTTYYFCAIANNAGGNGYGAVLNFTTVPTLSVIISATPGNGADPLSSVLSANPGGTATGTMNYSFWYNCNNASNVFATVVTACGALPAPAAGSCLGNLAGYKCDGVSTAPQAVPAHIYTPNGTYTGKVIVERSSATPAENRTPITVSAAPPPTITTTAATSITTTDATLNGTVNPNGISTTVTFRWGPTNVACASLPNVTSPSIHTGSTAMGITPRVISGLTSNVTYYFCATGTSTGGTTDGSVLSFTTTATLIPVLSVTPNNQTSPMNSVISASVSGTANSPTINYNFWYNCNNASTNLATLATACGALPAPAAGTCLGNAVGYKCDGVSTNPQSVPAYTYTTGTYWAKAVIQRGPAADAQQIVQVNVSAAPVPTVITDTQTLLTTSTATLNGRANPNGLAATGWFRYSPTNPGSCNDAFGTRVPLSGGTALGAGATLVAYSQPITGLSPSTTYYFCAIANNAGGNGYGAVLNFTTAGTLAVSFTASPANFILGASTNLASVVSGSVTGTINYSVWWDCNYVDGTPTFAEASAFCNPPAITNTCINQVRGNKCDNQAATTRTVSYIYTSAGTKSPMVLVERGGLVAMGTAAGGVVVIAPVPVATNTAVSVNNSNYCSVGPHANISWSYSSAGSAPGSTQAAYEAIINGGADIDVTPDAAVTGLNPSNINPEWRGTGTTGTSAGPSSGCNSGNADANPQVSCQLTFNTSYTVWVRVRNGYGEWSPWTRMGTYVYGTNPPVVADRWTTPVHRFPDPDFSTAPPIPAVDSPVIFTELAGTFSGSTFANWTWNFGDGTTPVNQADPTAPFGPTSITHVYTNTGTYNVTFTAQDDAGSCSVTYPVILDESLPRWIEVAPR